MTAKRQVLILHALLRAPHTHHGIVVVDAMGRVAHDVLAIADALDWRVTTLEAAQVNLNDLQVGDSPLSRLVRHAEDSEHEHVLVMQATRADAMMDDEWRGRLERLARRVRLVVACDAAPTASHGWKTVDLGKNG